MLSRRDFLQSSVLSTAALAAGSTLAAEQDPRALIVDTHQHLWDLKTLHLPWLSGAPEILNRTYHLKEYAEATTGLRVKSVYMEVDVARDELAIEARHVIDIAKGGQSTMAAAVIGGSPESDAFPGLIGSALNSPYVRGVRRVLHSDATPKGTCLTKTFIDNIRLLAPQDHSFDLCMRPTELLDGVKLTEQCPSNRFILDHCGNGDPRAFHKNLDPDKPASHTADEWKRGIDGFAARPNVICKISGVIAFLPKGKPAAETLAPIINHCLDAFGPDRVVFGGDWPVCLLGGSLRGWVDALTQIIRERPADQQRKLWSGNALKHYRLTAGT
ncbi:amidohydrolase family protein [Planctomyces sp. SH-PL14]|uniref:amidohydrolase family protein n=1 Tax=Planctomyces sp. SH-PL14 TaxID=1632864 RepID=UPI00078D1CCF|nr:amidohydrolase family protein [Planctomyces sp. SH-PL14]AMV19524.1 Amidohydrolase [Planctomyces sp. SH-PL14]